MLLAKFVAKLGFETALGQMFGDRLCMDKMRIVN